MRFSSRSCFIYLTVLPPPSPLTLAFEAARQGTASEGDLRGLGTLIMLGQPSLLFLRSFLHDAFVLHMCVCVLVLVLV